MTFGYSKWMICSFIIIISWNSQWSESLAIILLRLAIILLRLRDGKSTIDDWAVFAT